MKRTPKQWLSTNRPDSLLAKLKKPAIYYPLLIDLRDQSVLMVGGGRVAERKIRALLKSGARIRLISPTITRGLKNQVRQKKIRWHARAFKAEDLRGASLVFAATHNPRVNQLIAAGARKNRQLVNVANSPGGSNFLVPALLRRGDLVLAVSTSGRSPALAKQIRRELQKNYGREFSRYVAILGRIRRVLFNQVPNERQRRRILNRLINSRLLEHLRAGNAGQAKRLAQKILNIKELKL